MDAQVPAVVAVLVTTDPGPWFEEALSSLASQDYQELSVLVLAAGDDRPDVTERVGRVLPDAFVRHLPGRPGYGPATNEVLGMVEGAAFYLLCHDDVALDHDAVHKMVEESFRSNAGVVSPKFVNWDDPNVLLHVGMSCDKTGAVVDRILEGEVDHGQHDAVRDVFVAPGGCILIRADLFRELKGFDPGIIAMGEDLDLSWRCQVAGSRVVVAPDARVRHREVVAGGLVPLSVVGAGVTRGRRPVTLQVLQRRHELRAVLKCYTRISLVRVLPQAALLALGEVFVALLVRDGERARAVFGAWNWNVRRLTEISLLRGELAEHRLFPDAEVRRLQLRGSARLSRYLSRLSHQGLEAANTVAVSRGRPDRDDDRAEVAVLTGSVGAAFSEDSDFDELDDLGRRAGRDRYGRRVRSAPLSTERQRLVALVVTLFVIAAGSRELFFGSLPLIGQLAPLPSWSTTWHHFFSGWQSAGVGTTAPASAAFGVFGVAGTVFFGAMGTLQRVLLLGCIPLGAVGVSRFMRPLVSPRARIVTVICYLGLPLPYGALGAGRWDGLIAYALFPFIARRLAGAAGVDPFVVEAGRRWRSRPSGQVATLAALVAVGTSFAPALAPLVLVAAFAWAVGSLLVGGASSWRPLVVAGEAVVLALVLLAPWVVGTALAGKASVAVFGLPIAGATAPDWGEIVRFAVGPVARSPLVWLLVAAAALPLAIGRGIGFVWAARLWVMACASWAFALVAVRGDMGSFAPSAPVVLAPAALAVAACVGLGISSFEHDLSGRVFGWRQVVGVLAIVFAAVGLLPVAAAAVNGRWDMPAQGVEQTLSFLGHPGPTDARVLWLGDPRALPVGGWSIEPGLAYALTPATLPDLSQVLTPAGPGPAVLVADAVHLATSGGTVHFGRLIASAGVRYVVLVEGLAPSTVGSLTPSVDAPPPPGLQTDLLAQSDLHLVPGDVGISVFENDEAMPVTGQRAAPLPTVAKWSYPSGADVVGWQPVLASLFDPASAPSPVQTGTFYAGDAPAGRFALTVDGRSVRQRPAFGWAAQFAITKGHADLSLSQFPYVPLAVLAEVVVWVILLAALVGRRRRPPPAHGSAT